MEKEASCWLNPGERGARALDETAGMLFDKMKDNTGIVAEEGRVELQ